MGQASGCCTKREDEPPYSPKGQSDAPISSRTPSASARKRELGEDSSQPVNLAAEPKGVKFVVDQSETENGGAEPGSNGAHQNGAAVDNGDADEAKHCLGAASMGLGSWNTGEDDDAPSPMSRIRRKSFSEGAGLEVTCHRLAMLTLKKDVTRETLEGLQASMSACVEFVPGLARWTFEFLLPDTEGLSDGHTHAMYLAFTDHASLDTFDEHPKHHEIEAVLSPLLETEESCEHPVLVVSWEQRVHLKETGVDRLMMFRASDDAKLAKVLEEEAECVKEIEGYTMYHHGPHCDDHGSLNKDLNYGFYASFEDVEALERYKTHPKHKEVYEKLVKCLDGPVGPDTIVCVNCELV